VGRKAFAMPEASGRGHDDAALDWRLRSIAFAILCLATLVMGRIENRKFSEYGLPLRQALGKDFWIGCLSGFLSISGTLLAMFLLHRFRITGFALHGKAILYALTAWAIAFLMVGLSEECLNRGYLQYTLASGIGFWPAAFVMSGFFAFGHAFNPHETLTGVASVVPIASLSRRVFRENVRFSDRTQPGPDACGEASAAAVAGRLGRGRRIG
jgi:membrane protease YdiL (CAAX protease family)